MTLPFCRRTERRAGGFALALGRVAACQEVRFEPVMLRPVVLLSCGSGIEARGG